ncbi:MAG: ectoine/hydroxyectoine ABC transporter substrate-binding protein EhuB [Methylobacteriaceae bacterium]|jgi:polar amino acid transport system substrate-binding protein|nr:ectoine/hydroxyectoine ABC transporter substrate-binding protein EhuB [Methylobacteriaceae bacterium]
MKLSRILAISLAAWLTALPASADSLLDKAKSNGQFVAGIANEQPYGYIATDGTITGANVELLRTILKALGSTNLDMPIVEWGALVPGLSSKRFDIIGAGLFITKERCKVIGYSDPVTRSGGAFVVKKGNPLNLHSLKDVAANAKARLGTQNGSNQVVEVKNAGIPDANVVLFNKDTEALAALQADRVDAIYFPDAEVIALLKRMNADDIERAMPFEQILDADGNPTYNYHAYGLPKGDQEFIDAFNVELARLRKSGELLKLLQEFGYTADELPPEDLTAAKLCP